jgi:hypothetical protein
VMSTLAHPRVCYLVMSHADGDMVERTVRILRTEDPTSSVVIRHDARVHGMAVKRFADISDVEVAAHTKPSEWGSWDLTERMLEGVSIALRGDRTWDWLVTLSGQSYPLSPPAHLAAALGSVGEAAILGLAPPEQQAAESPLRWRPFGADRARYQYRALPGVFAWQKLWVRQSLLAFSGRQPLGGFSFHRPSGGSSEFRAQWVRLKRSPVFSGASRPLKASQWSVLSRAAAETAVTMLDPSSRWRDQFAHSFTSDELAIPSVLNAAGFPIVDASLHALRWPGGPSPALLTDTDHSWLLARPEPFARKVSSERSLDLLELLDVARRARSETGSGINENEARRWPN